MTASGSGQNRFKSQEESAFQVVTVDDETRIVHFCLFIQFIEQGTYSSTGHRENYPLYQIINMKQD